MHHRWSFLRIVCCLVLCIAANQLLCPVAAAAAKLSDLAQAAFVQLSSAKPPRNGKLRIRLTRSRLLGSAVITSRREVGVCAFFIISD